MFIHLKNKQFQMKENYLQMKSNLLKFHTHLPPSPPMIRFEKVREVILPSFETRFAK